MFHSCWSLHGFVWVEPFAAFVEALFDVLLGDGRACLEAEDGAHAWFGAVIERSREKMLMNAVLCLFQENPISSLLDCVCVVGSDWQ